MDSLKRITKGFIMSIPNLDCLTCGELMDFWFKYNKPKRKEAQELIGDKRKGYIRITQNLAYYALNKGTAINCRLNGQINVAAMYERICETLYANIPNNLKW